MKGGVGEHALIQAFNGRANATFTINPMLATFSGDRQVYSPWLNSLVGPDLIPLFFAAQGAKLRNVDNFVNVTHVWHELGFEDDALDIAKTASMGDDGAYYGIPILGDAELCMYNRRVVEDELGLAAPTTFSELKRLCAAVKATGRTCLAAQELPFVPPTVLFDFLFITMHGNSAYVDFFEGNISFTDPRVNNTLAEVLNLLELGYIEPNRAFEPPNHYLVADLASDDVVIGCGMESTRFFAVERGLNASDIVTFYWPTYDGLRGSRPVGEPTDATIGLLVNLGIPQSSAYKNEALEYLRYAGCRDVQAELLGKLGDAYPIRKSLQYLVGDSLAAKQATSSKVFRLNTFVGFGVARLGLRWSSAISEMLLAPTPAAANAAVVDNLESFEIDRQRLVHLQTLPPTTNIASGTYTTAIVVTLVSPMPDAVIYFTLFADEVPTTASTVYSGPISLGTTGTYHLKAFAQASGLKPSSLVTGVYSIQLASEKPANSLALILGIVLSLVALTVAAIAIIAYVLHKRRSIVYRLGSDDKLVIPASSVVLSVCVGEGSYGTVYRGRWRATDVAVKRTRQATLTPKRLRQFVDEASTLLRLRHPNVLIFMGVILDPPAIVTEFMDHGSLYDVLHKPNLVLDPSIIFKWAHNVAQGLEFLAAAGVVHGDVKSLNVLFDSSWSPKIADFGMSSIKADSGLVAVAAASATRPPTRFVSSHSRSFRHRASTVAPATGAPPATTTHISANRSLMSGAATADGIRFEVGTLFWAAPEVLIGGASAMSEASDTYAFAITLWEMATRSDLYPGENPLSVALEVIDGRRPDLTCVSSVFEPIVHLVPCLWSNEPSERLSLHATSELLESTYSLADVMYPKAPTHPSGLVVAVHLAIPGIAGHLLKDHEATAELISSFHQVVNTSLVATGAHIFRAMLGAVTVAFAKSSQLLPLARALEDIERVVGPVAVVAASGMITHGPSLYGTSEAGGEVIEKLRTTWASVFGLAYCGLDVSDYAENRPSSLWASAPVSSGFFVEAGLGAELAARGVPPPFTIVHEASESKDIYRIMRTTDFAKVAELSLAAKSLQLPSARTSTLDFGRGTGIYASASRLTSSPDAQGSIPRRAGNPARRSGAGANSVSVSISKSRSKSMAKSTSRPKSRGATRIVRGGSGQGLAALPPSPGLPPASASLQPPSLSPGTIGGAGMRTSDLLRPDSEPSILSRSMRGKRSKSHRHNPLRQTIDAELSVSREADTSLMDSSSASVPAGTIVTDTRLDVVTEQEEDEMTSSESCHQGASGDGRGDHKVQLEGRAGSKSKAKGRSKAKGKAKAKAKGRRKAKAKAKANRKVEGKAKAKGKGKGKGKAKVKGKAKGKAKKRRSDTGGSRAQRSLGSPSRKRRETKIRRVRRPRAEAATTCHGESSSSHPDSPSAHGTASTSATKHDERVHSGSSNLRLDSTALASSALALPLSALPMSGSSASAHVSPRLAPVLGVRGEKWICERKLMRELVLQEGPSVRGSCSQVVEAELDGAAVVVKVLLRQAMDLESLVRFARDSAAATTVAACSSVLAPLIHVCFDAPYIGLIGPHFQDGSLATVERVATTKIGRKPLRRELHTPKTAAGAPIRLDKDGAHTVIVDVLQALVELHERGMAHGSLRPSNIFLRVDDSGSVVCGASVTDFGLGGIKSSMGTMTVVPSVAYMSPDELRGSAASPESDMFVFGTLLYELVTGQTAFSGINALEVGHAILMGTRPALVDIFPLAVRDMIAACWADNPRLRPQASHLLADFKFRNVAMILLPVDGPK
ncbi:TKL protein kinase [Thecamonas trahens ATCC 50062]|uniref:TKL protein kinase n=1 Tax=Thecamonas trahens ATCC 50062 TaxID=461836 RepID=A0A0L0DSC1_THETB|nr:TKL protein kinase [Thecamonas trahens ATCC 50062]KNC55107.1 TKL protein kinase [Thecamonas trahens ATCC 50062]|eukprot:XP_013753290.1 TKL protein kinase [Thecamonas trahens ATCC 50062]